MTSRAHGDPRRPRRAAPGSARAVLGAIVLVTSTACGTAGTPTAPTAAATSSTPSTSTGAPLPSPSGDLPPIAELSDVGGLAASVPDADWVQVANGAAWSTLGSGELVRLDPRTGRVTTRLDLRGGVCTAMDRGFGSLWVAVCVSPTTLVRVDPATRKVVARIPLGDVEVVEEGSVASAEGSVWVLGRSPDPVLLRIDPRRNEVVDTYPVTPGTAGVRAGLGGLWATNPDEGTLSRLDPATGEVLASVVTGVGPRFLAVGEGAVWVQNNGSGSVTRVYPETGGVVATIVVDDGSVEGGDLAVGGHRVWARTSGALVAVIDPATNTVVARIGSPEGSGSVAADDRAAWISAHDVDLVARVTLPLP